jgi:anti-sigma factor RsiW
MMMSPDFCSNFCDDRLDLYALGRLPDVETTEVEEHLLLCETCRDRLSETDRFIAALRYAAAVFNCRLTPVTGSQPAMGRSTHVPALASSLPFAAFVLATTPAFRTGRKETRSLFEAMLRATGGDARIMADPAADFGADPGPAPVPALHFEF